MKNPFALFRTYLQLKTISRNATLVLAYHNIIDATHVGSDQYSVTTANFFSHLRILKKFFTVISPREFPLKPSSRKPGVLITFDDGKLNNYTEALPILSKFNLPAFFFITTDYIGKQGYMSEEQIKHATGARVSIGSHSVTHPDFGAIDNMQTIHELIESKKILDSLTGADTFSFAYPYGNIQNIKEPDKDFLKQAGYRYAFLFGTTNHYRIEDPYRIPRLAVTDVLGTTLLQQIVATFLMQKTRES
jgi:peptidoglycan/xylan/chitin deacetylase (PgdA/CDA1 family)